MRWLDAVTKNDNDGYQEAVEGGVVLEKGDHVLVLSRDGFMGLDMRLRVLNGAQAHMACWAEADIPNLFGDRDLTECSPHQNAVTLGRVRAGASVNRGIERRECDRCGHQLGLHVERDTFRVCVVCNRAAHPEKCSIATLLAEQ